MGRYTENTKPICDILKTDTDLNVIIRNTEKCQMPVPTIKYQRVGSVRYFIYSALFHQLVE